MGSFFVARPVFAATISIVITLIGAFSYFSLPTARFPQIAPPNIAVRASLTGANAVEVADAVASPIEYRINGAPGMIYVQSVSTNDGEVTINATFSVGTDIKAAAADVLTRVNRATPSLPQSAQHHGVEIRRSSRQLLANVAIYADPNSGYDELFLSNYASTQVIPALRRVPGMGQVRNLSSKRYAMRIWLDPAKMEYMGIAPSDVVSAINAQNRVVAAGKLGAAPMPNASEVTRTVRAVGRLETAEEFGDIVLRANPDSSVVRINDVGRVELGAEVYGVNAKFSGKPSATIDLYQEPGANAVQLMKEVHQLMDRLTRQFPAGVHWQVAADRTRFVTAAIDEVLITLAIAIALVIAITYLFLQSWRTTLIPCLAIPVALVGTFGPMAAFGFSLNTLSLLGLVLAVGLVVDDAIVVVENVERKMEKGHEPEEATRLAMAEVTGPVFATTIVLLVLFIPVAFIPGITGRLYNQFALTIAFSVGFSGVVSLTLTPALCAVLLKRKEDNEGEGDEKGWLHTVRAPLRWINHGIGWAAGKLGEAVGWLGQHIAWVVGVFVGLLALTVLLLLSRPSGFVPSEDQGYFYTVIEMQPGASVDRTQRVVEMVEQRLLKEDAVDSTVAVAGNNVITGVTAPYYGFVTATLKPWGKRSVTAGQLMERLGLEFDKAPAARIRMIDPPNLPGLGTHGGLTLEIEDRGGGSFTSLLHEADSFIDKVSKLPGVESAFPTAIGGVPQTRLALDRVKAQQLGLDMNTLFDDLSLYLGSTYVNLFNRFGRTYQVYVQAEPQARRTEAELAALTIPNKRGEAVRVSSLIQLEFVTGSTAVTHFNTHPAVEVAITPSGSSGAVIDSVRKLAKQELPRNFAIEWADVAYQQIQAGGYTPVIFALGIILVFLVLAAQYESWLLPLVVVLSVPLGALGALGWLALRGIPLNIFVQIGLLVLIGLAAKNGILLVAFAQERRMEGKGRLEAAKLAAEERMRPILMTALAFTLGSFPLATASGAGANARIAIGTTVIGGMIVATILTLFITPTFFVLADRFRWTSDSESNSESVSELEASD